MTHPAWVWAWAWAWADISIPAYARHHLTYLHTEQYHATSTLRGRQSPTNCGGIGEGHASCPKAARGRRLGGLTIDGQRHCVQPRRHPKSSHLMRLAARQPAVACVRTRAAAQSHGNCSLMPTSCQTSFCQHCRASPDHRSALLARIDASKQAGSQARPGRLLHARPSVFASPLPSPASPAFTRLCPSV